jgi:hypothetical protein
MNHRRNTSGEINVGLICEINKIPENVNDLGPTVSVHLSEQMPKTFRMTTEAVFLVVCDPSMNELRVT